MLIVAALVWAEASANEPVQLVCEGTQYVYREDGNESRPRTIGVEIAENHLRFAVKEENEDSVNFRLLSSSNQCRGLGTACFSEAGVFVHQSETRTISIPRRAAMIENRYTDDSMNFEQRYYVDRNGNGEFSRTEVTELFEASCVLYTGAFRVAD